MKEEVESVFFDYDTQSLTKNITFYTDLDIRIDGKNPNNKYKKEFPDWMPDFIKTRKAILESMGLELIEVRHKPSSSRRGHHFVWDCHSKKKLSDTQVNMTQFLLNDCIVRCAINRQRILRGVKRWNKIFSRVVWKKEQMLTKKCKNCRLRRAVNSFMERKE